MGFNAQRNDNAKALRGAWRDIMGGRFLIARAGNENFLTAQERNGKRTATTAAERQQALYRSIAEGILLDWQEVEDAEGKAIPYSVDAAVQVLNDNPDLVTAVLSEANDMENFRREDVDQQIKKPQKRSSTD
tara:strand:- start:41464 stop:41859 length:396 start_codon:yes stop_codon:yes gene_type:complete